MMEANEKTTYLSCVFISSGLFCASCKLFWFHPAVSEWKCSPCASKGLLFWPAALAEWWNATSTRCTPPPRRSSGHLTLSWKSKQLQQPCRNPSHKRRKKTQVDQLCALSKHPCRLRWLLCEENGLNVSDLCDLATGWCLVFHRRA